ncbi:uncharacterized protein [Asterias amurensis]|uniref:uncharacterized protein isoform X2 n=1 Tax=Asterias amurensis TaxID=7602 RepID=UPI003AB592E5
MDLTWPWTLTLTVTVVYFVMMVTCYADTDTDSDSEKPTNSYSEAAQKGKRSTTERFTLGPDGQMSVLRDKMHLNLQDRRYQHEDENGSCCCGLCNLGRYIRTFCTCSAVNIEPQQITICQSVRYGFEYMDRVNNSTVPYRCTERCKANQEKTSDCTPIADITCQCKEGWFNPNDSGEDNIPSECRRIPGCRAGEEPIRQVLNDEVTYTCQQCQQGYFKLEGNSTKSCEPHRVCETRPGSRTSDVVCLYDDFVRSDTTPVSTTTNASPTQGTQLPLITTLLQRLVDKMNTSQTEVSTQTPSTTGENDHQPTTPKTDSPGELVYKFGYKTAFFILLTLNLFLLSVFVGYMILKCKKPQTQGQKVTYSEVQATADH